MKLISKAFASAAATAAYVMAFAWVMSRGERWFGNQPDVFLMPVMMILLFIVSACVTGALVLLRPINMYMNGNRMEAIQLFAYTVAMLAVIAIVVAFLIA